jgi:hypothetical protein
MIFSQSGSQFFLSKAVSAKVSYLLRYSISKLTLYHAPPLQELRAYAFYVYAGKYHAYEHVYKFEVKEEEQSDFPTAGLLVFHDLDRNTQSRSG